MLKDLGIVVNENNKSGQLFLKLFPNFMDIKYSKPSEYVDILWNSYLSVNDRNSNLNGNMFELILTTLCIRENLLPIYREAKVAFVPNINYDIMFYSAECGPICWSAKTSLRERYKQADLESIALKYVHRKALSYLVTLEKKEAIGVKNKIRSGDVIGLDKVIVANTEDMDLLIEELTQYKFELPPTVTVIESSQIVTKEKVGKVFK